MYVERAFIALFNISCVVAKFSTENLLDISALAIAKVSVLRNKAIPIMVVLELPEMFICMKST